MCPPVAASGCRKASTWVILRLIASVFKGTPTGAVYGGGLVGSIPTATNDALGLDQWLLGPELIGALIREWGVVGGLISHQWDVAGEGSFDTKITAGQLFFVYNLKNGWQLTSSPLFSYDHEASSGNQLTFPLGLGYPRPRSSMAGPGSLASSTNTIRIARFIRPRTGRFNSAYRRWFPCPGRNTGESDVT